MIAALTLAIGLAIGLAFGYFIGQAAGRWSEASRYEEGWHDGRSYGGTDDETDT